MGPSQCIPSKDLIDKGICFMCELPAMPRCYSDAGRREFFISGLCEKCFDNLFKDEDEGDTICSDDNDDIAF